MDIIGLVVRKFLEWLLELPPNLLGRRIERRLDRIAERRRRHRRVGARRTRIRKK
jgi:hypothetical protein